MSKILIDRPGDDLFQVHAVRSRRPAVRHLPASNCRSADDKPAAWNCRSRPFGTRLTRGLRALRDRQTAGLADVEAVTFATQTNSFVLLDGNDRPLTPMILWPDLRAAELEGRFGVAAESRSFAPPPGIPAAELPVHGGQAALAAAALPGNLEQDRTSSA